MGSKDDVSAWGAAWLQAWCSEPGLSDHVREDRARTAENWRHATLAWAVGCWFDERQIFGGQDVEEFNASNAANEALMLYMREGNGLLVWRAYREFRAAGMQVPEAILQKLERWAEALEHASGQAEIAAAIEMTGPRGGAQGASQLKSVVRHFHIASEVNMLLKLSGRKMTAREAIDRVAQRLGMEASVVHSIYYGWLRPSKAATKQAPAKNLASVMQAFGKLSDD